MRPECNRDLFVFFEDGSITSVEELAHVIAQSDQGPRADTGLEISLRDEYENLLVLCPGCHTEIDKASKQFSRELLFKWKSDHEVNIASCFKVPTIDSRNKLAEEVERLLLQNRAVFDQYGPFSAHRDNPLTDAKAAWDRAVRETIVPNNRRVAELLIKNSSLLTKDEAVVVEQFRIHKDGLEYNHLSGEKNSAAPPFPKGMNSILKE